MSGSLREGEFFSENASVIDGYEAHHGSVAHFEFLRLLG